MKLSVILPIYNVGNFLSKCIESLLNQNFEDYEIILVNDGSTDNSLEVSEFYQKKSDKITLINQANQGSGIARNTGLKIASGDYIFFCDPDDYITGEFFRKVAEVTEDDPDLVVFGYWDEYEKNSTMKKIPLTFEKEKKLDQKAFRNDFCELFKKNVMYTLWNKIYKKSFLDEFGLFFGNAPMGQDTRFNLEVYKKVRTVKIVPNSYYHYIQVRPGSSTGKYRDNRIKLKLEELEKIKELLNFFKITNNDLIKKIKSDILTSSCNHIINSELPLKSKKQKISEILNLKEFDNLYCNNEYMNSINNFFLSKRYVRSYIVLRKMYSHFGLKN